MAKLKNNIREIVLKKGCSLNCYREGFINAIYTNNSSDITIRVFGKFGVTYLAICDFSSATTITFMCDDFEIEEEVEE